MASSQDPPFLNWHFTDQTNNFHLHLQNRTLFLLLFFFSAILLIAAFSLYAHWLCRHRRLSNSIAAALPADNSSPGLDPAIVNSFPIILVAKNIVGSECCICLGEFVAEEKVKVLPKCNHAYHSECVDKWFTTSSSCPLCRTSLGVLSISIHKSSTPPP